LYFSGLYSALEKMYNKRNVYMIRRTKLKCA
jgi:hypothetical protein